MKSIQPHQRNIDWLEMYHDAPSITCLLRDAAAGVGVSDLMEVRLFIERSCEHVQERYRKRYIDIYTGMVVDSVLELKKGSPLRADHDEENTSWVLRRLNETRTPLLAGLTVLHRTLIMKEPLHPEGTPFPGGDSVKEVNGVYYCPVKDRQKDNPRALCDICIARQTPKLKGYHDHQNSARIPKN